MIVSRLDSGQYNSRQQAFLCVLKIHTHVSVSKYILQKKLRLIVRAFITCQFSNYHLVGMRDSGTLSNKTNELSKRTNIR